MQRIALCLLDNLLNLLLHLTPYLGLLLADSCLNSRAGTLAHRDLINIFTHLSLSLLLKNELLLLLHLELLPLLHLNLTQSVL